MNKFKGILVLGTGVNIFCGSSYNAKLDEITIDGGTDVTNNIKSNDVILGQIKEGGLKFEKEDLGPNVKVFAMGAGYLIVGTSAMYNKQDEKIRKACVQLDGSDCYLYIFGLGENDIKKVTITKDDKTKGKYKVTIPTPTPGGKPILPVA